MSRRLPNSYAKALFDLAQESGKAKEIEEELEKVSSLLDREPRLNAFFHRQDKNRQEQHLLLNQILDILGIHGLSLRFLFFLLQKERLPLLPKIFRRYRALMDEGMKRVRVTLSVPSRVRGTDLEAIREAISVRVGREVAIEQREEPSLLGGWVAQIGESELWDASIKGELAWMKRRLLGDGGSL